MVIEAAVFEVENLKKMGLSPCASWRSGAANQKVVSVWALVILQNKTKLRLNIKVTLFFLNSS
jgi:hypothetical protein